MSKYTELAAREVIDQTIAALEKKNFHGTFIETKQAALEKIKELIPQNASVQNGASRSLEEIGFIEYLKSANHGWNNLHAQILAETDQIKQGLLRKQATLSDYYLGSVHALTHTGELVIASNTGSQLPNIVYSSQNLIFVIGAQKLVTDISDAFKRIQEQVIPLEDVRMKGVYGVGTTWNKTVILHGENPMMGRNIHVLIVNELLGF